jgi:two-component system response regulator YesN
MEMKKILIVDDEYIVRLGLKTIVDWAKFGYTVAGEANNGKEAFFFFENNPVDVILTDIKMPVMDGLELTRKVRAKNKKIRIIILSHYDEFSYAQEAVKLGAFRYILKSELTKTNLENVLKSLYLSSDVPEPAEQKAGWKEQWEEYIEKYMLPTFLRQIKDENNGARKLPDPQPPAIPASFSEANEYIVFSVSCRTTLLPGDAKEKFPRTIRVLFDEAFGNLLGRGYYYDDNFQFAAIVPMRKPRAGEEQFVAEKINNPSVQIIKNVRQYYDVNLFVGVSSFGKIEDCHMLLREAHTARTGCFFSEKLFVGIFNRKTAAIAGRKNGLVNYTKLVDLIDTNQKEAMLEYIQNIFRDLRNGKNYAVVYDAFIDFLSVGKLIHEKYQLEEEASLSKNKFKHDVFFDLPFIADAEMYVYELYLELLSAKRNGKVSYSYIVKKCIDFIHGNYQNNIGLSEAAEKAGVSHSYLSFIFKQETGVNFNAALTQYRIEQAKRLLAATGLRIYEVAEKVGFSNPYYFSKVFKEISGYTCKEYRDLAGN